MASLAAFLALRGALWLLVEVFRVGHRAAWLPAKGFAWLGISYPLFRFAVFGRTRTSAARAPRHLFPESGAPFQSGAAHPR